MWRRKGISTELLIIIHKHCHSYDDKITSQHFSEELLVHTPIKRNEANALGGISNLTLQASNALNTALPNVFPTVDNILSSEDVCDKVRSRWRLYQTEIIPEDVYLNEKEEAPIKKHSKKFNIGRKDSWLLQYNLKLATLMKPKAVILKNLFCILKKIVHRMTAKWNILSCLFIQIDFISPWWE